MAGVNVPYEPALMECLAASSTPLIIDDFSSIEVSAPVLHDAFASLVAVLLEMGQTPGLYWLQFNERPDMSIAWQDGI